MTPHPVAEPVTTPVHTEPPSSPAVLRLPATLLLSGQLLYIVITQFHTGGEANDHDDVFAHYARSGSWALVHLGQFASMAIFLAGLLALFHALESQTRFALRVSRFGSALAIATLALYGFLQAVDGVALKHAVSAWADSTHAEMTVRFASAEALRWLEWGARSYQNLALGLALLLLAAVVTRSAWIPRPVVPLIGLAGLAYLVQGWVVGSDGFSHPQSIAIVAAFVLDVVWMTWLVRVAYRTRDAKTPVGSR